MSSCNNKSIQIAMTTNRTKKKNKIKLKYFYRMSIEIVNRKFIIRFQYELADNVIENIFKFEWKQSRYDNGVEIFCLLFFFFLNSKSHCLTLFIYYILQFHHMTDHNIFRFSPYNDCTNLNSKIYSLLLNWSTKCVCICLEHIEHYFFD